MTTYTKYLFAGALAMVLTLSPTSAPTPAPNDTPTVRVYDSAPSSSRGTPTVALGRKIMDRY